VSELTLTIIKLGFLAVLWLFVLSTVSAVRSDLFGTAPKAVKPPKAATPSRSVRKAARGAPTRLVVTEGPDRDKAVSLGLGPIVVGRGAEAGLALTDEYVSTRHARFVPRDGAWYVEDLGSTNGTSVGGSRVTTPVSVTAKTPVRLGKTTVELRS
jgi:hypothetical protein